MSKGKSLINSFGGDISSLGCTIDKLKEISLYDESGHVDTDLMCALMKVLTDFNELQKKLNVVIGELFGIDLESEVNKKKGRIKAQPKGYKPEDILKLLTLDDDNIIRLPQIQLPPETYAKVKQYIIEAGGSWEGGRTQGFKFPFDAHRVYDILRKGERCRLQKEYQFFETPSALADKLVALNTAIECAPIVLEPSAGRGGLMKAIWRKFPQKDIDYYELMSENREVLKKFANATYKGEDFLQCADGAYKAIVANPPFAKNSDIRHVLHMFDLLAEGGVLTAITSCHWLQANESECKKFRAFFEAKHGYMEEVGEKVFAESGTTINTLMIKLTK